MADSVISEPGTGDIAIVPKPGARSGHYSPRDYVLGVSPTLPAA